MKEGCPAIVVLFDSARSAEPPHSSGMTSARAVRILPLAARVATPLASASHVGSASSKPSGRARERTRKRRAACSGFAFSHAANFSSHSARTVRERSARVERTCSMTSVSTSKVCSGSKPRSFFMLLISSSPRAAPCDLPVPCFVGDGQAMTVRTMMKVGLSVTFLPSSIAARSASTSST